MDEGYSGEIMVHMINLSDIDYHVHKGDKIAQLVVVPCIYVDVDIVDSINGGARGNSGFGSTGQ